MKKSIQDELENGNPKKWKKKALPKCLLINFFLGVLSLLSFVTMVFSIPILIMLIIRTILDVKKYSKSGKRGGGEPADAFSASYGVNDTRKFNISLVFRIIYSAVFVIIGIAIFFVLYYCIFQNIGGFKADFLSFIMGISISCFVLFQIRGAFLFKNEIKRYACPTCGKANTMIKGGTSDYNSREEDRYVKTTGEGTYKSGIVQDSSGKEIGSVYSYSSGQHIYQTYRVDSWKQHYKCSCCGRVIDVSCSSTAKKGGRHY